MGTEQMATTREKYRLGLDLGTNSIGWAAVALDDHDEPRSVLDMGVRVFSDGRNPKDGTSLAMQRRMPRGQRRRRDRYLRRRDRLMDALTVSGLMPPDGREGKKLAKSDPYDLRARALAGPLEPHELGRALFHLNQRRGFKSNRKAAPRDDEDGKTRAETRQLRDRIAQSGARTLGEFMASRRQKGKTVRARPGLGLYPDRAMYESEFDQIRKAQAPHHNVSKKQWDRIRDLIFFQRPLKPVDPGWCQLESGERRAETALPSTQEFRMLQEVNNLRVQVGTGPERPLDSAERSRVLERLRSGRDLDLKRPTRDIGLPAGAVFNLSRGGRRKVKGDESAARMMKRSSRGRNAVELFGERWLRCSLDERNAIVTFLLETEDPEEVLDKARCSWGMNDLQATAIADVRLPSGHSHLSEAAIRKLLPHLERGLLYSDAVIEAGYPHHSDFRNAEAHGQLPYYGRVLEREVVDADPTKDPKQDGEPARYGRISNPTVHIGLNQVRRVVNRIMETYGKPADIVVELARDLKMNGDQKAQLRKRQKDNSERKERHRERLESAGISATPHTFFKLRLWEEQGPPQARICPYSGSVLSFEMVVSNATEIDHILPFSRTLDDSHANKVVCIAEANRYKGDRPPYDAFGHGPSGYDYSAILERAAGFPPGKRWRFESDAMTQFEEDGRFLDRQLNETRYLSRTARQYLAYLYDERTEGKPRVRVIPGRMTALLRRGWGLEGVLRATESDETARKQRDDHRHHAIDAFVVANTTQGLLQRFASAAAIGGDTDRAERRLAAVAGEALPWEGFHREDLTPFLDRMVVSHKPDRGMRRVKVGTTGQLHNETAYGLVEFTEDGASKIVVRKRLDTFKKRSDLGAVRDEALSSALKELWDASGGRPADFARQAETVGVQLRGSRLRVRSARVVDSQRVVPIRDEAGKPYKGYMPGSNEFADVWRMPDGSWRITVASTFEANQSDFAVEKLQPHPAAKRIMRLWINDMGALGEGQHRRVVRVRKITNARDRTVVVLDEHNEAKGMRENKYSARQLKQHGFRKVGVNEIGRVRDPGPRAQ